PPPALFPYTTLFRSFTSPSTRRTRSRCCRAAMSAGWTRSSPCWGRGPRINRADKGDAETRTVLQAERKISTDILFGGGGRRLRRDRKSTRLNSSHQI